MPASRACTSHHCRQHPARFDRSTWYRSRLHPPPPMTTPEHGANESAALLPFLRRTSRSVLAASPSCCGAKTKGHRWIPPAHCDPHGAIERVNHQICSLQGGGREMKRSRSAAHPSLPMEFTRRYSAAWRKRILIGWGIR